MKGFRCVLAVALVSAAFGLQLRDAIAAVVVARAADLADLSLEELGNVVVTSVSRRQERLAAAPASIYVISREDIRRSGVTSLPEALRLAPNLQVARAGIEHGSVINFVQVDGRVRFEVNVAVAESGLRLSSRLLIVATRVKAG